ncbi:MAG TPA: ABC transporter permease [Candidatus Accumulibacter phosphatis]|nr:ABC transporter permease [Candidatus Accumulibacter phosphatis]
MGGKRDRIPTSMNDRAPSSRSEATLLIDGTPPSWRAYWRELRAFHEVTRMLIRRDLIVRFRQTYFGLAWLLFKPLMLMAVMSFAFGYLAGFESNNAIPYPLISFCGVIPWYFFSNAVPDGMNSLVGHLHIIQKTYFPRAIIPIAAVAVDAAEFLVAWLLFALGCLWFGYLPSWQIVFFPLFCLQLLLLCTAIGLLLSVLNVRFRDIGNLVPFLLTIGFFLTPAGYTLARIPAQWQAVYALNPLVGIIEGLRWSLLRGMDGFPLLPVIFSLATTLSMALGAAQHFLAAEADLVDRA